MLRRKINRHMNDFVNIAHPKFMYDSDTANSAG
jgi:hypothetical protein